MEPRRNDSKDDEDYVSRLIEIGECHFLLSPTPLDEEKTYTLPGKLNSAYIRSENTNHLYYRNKTNSNPLSLELNEKQLKSFNDLKLSYNSAIKKEDLIAITLITGHNHDLDFSQQYDFCEKLAVSYYNKAAKIAGKEEDPLFYSLDNYIKSAAFYNYMLNLNKSRKNDEERSDSDKIVVEVCLLKVYLDFCQKLKMVEDIRVISNQYNYMLITYQYKSNLEKIRTQAEEGIRPLIKAKGPKQGKDSDEKQDSQERLNNIVNVHLNIHRNMIKYIGGLFDTSIKMLGNKPPCDYAVIGLGSLARKESTPFSDLEFGILIRERGQEEYFKKVTYLMYIIIVNLGETIIPGIGINALANSKFFDEITPRGFSFDPMLNKAWKTPLGKSFRIGESKGDKEFEFNLIRTPEEMTHLLILDEKDKYNQNQNKIKFNMASTLSTVVHIIGEEKLVNDYLYILKTKLKKDALYTINRNNYEDKMCKVIACETFKKDKEEYRIASLNAQNNLLQDKLFNIKKDLYRLPCLLIEDLILYFCLLDNQQEITMVSGQKETILSLVRINELIKQKFHDSSTMKKELEKLEQVISEILLLRLEIYLHYKKQKEYFLYCSPKPGSKAVDNSDNKNTDIFEIDKDKAQLISELIQKISSFLKISEEEFKKFEEELKKPEPKALHNQPSESKKYEENKKDNTLIKRKPKRRENDGSHYKKSKVSDLGSIQEKAKDKESKPSEFYQPDDRPMTPISQAKSVFPSYSRRDKKREAKVKSDDLDNSAHFTDSSPKPSPPLFSFSPSLKKDNDIMKKYNLQNISEESLEKALRMAACNNKIEDVEYLAKRIRNINAQDNNPDSRRTALHWAFIKGHTNVISILLKYNAGRTIIDAQGNAAIPEDKYKDLLIKIGEAKSNDPDSIHFSGASLASASSTAGMISVLSSSSSGATPFSYQQVGVSSSQSSLLLSSRPMVASSNSDLLSGLSFLSGVAGSTNSSSAKSASLSSSSAFNVSASKTSAMKHQL